MSLPAEAAEEESLEAYEYQVGGHTAHGGADGPPASLRDSRGRFLKKLQASERGEREKAFYAEMERLRALQAAGADAGAAQLAAWVPRCYGWRLVGESQYLQLEDVAAPYSRPCIADIKIGFRTWYPWASSELRDKYRRKDEATTQGSLGFRLCGLMVHDERTGGCWRTDRHWGKQLTQDGVKEALRRFADNGHLSLPQLLEGPGMLLEQLRAVAGVFARQARWHLFSASVLVVYEGAARSPDGARPAVRLVDFAHAFPTPSEPAGGGAGAGGPTGPDANFFGGVSSLISVLERLAAEDGDAAGTARGANHRQALGAAGP